MVTRSIESAQRKVEARNFDIRKQLLEYDDVANDQRKMIYALRNELLESQDISPRIADLRAGVLADMFRVYVPPRTASRSSGTSPAWRTRSRPSSPRAAAARVAGGRAASSSDEALLERIVARADDGLRREGAGRARRQRSASTSAT